MKLGKWLNTRIPFDLMKRTSVMSFAAAPYLTPRKVANLVRCEAEKYRRVLHPQSFPYVAVVDIANTCNLRCTYCPTGARRESGRETSLIALPVVEKLIAQVGPYLISANLFNWGEPLLHPRIADIIKLFHEGGVYTSISSNLSLPRPELVEGLCDAGLDYLVVSISGASQAAQEIYHRKSNIDWVIENTRRLIEHRRRTGSRRPVVEWKYLVFKHNRHEVEAARALAGRIGVDLFRGVRAGGPEQATLDKGSVPERKVRVKRCHQLWHTVVINADGGVSPCCYLFFREDDVGDFLQDDIGRIRNNSRSVMARKLFSPSCLAELPMELQHPCLKCELVHGQPHLQSYLSANPFAVKGYRTGGP